MDDLIEALTILRRYLENTDLTVYLPAAMAERAAELGGGNVSAGVRIALQKTLS